MKKTISLLLFLTSIISYSQTSTDSIVMYGYNDAVLEKKHDLASKMFVLVTTNEDYVYSMKLDSEDLFGEKVWLERTHSYKRIKNKQGKWIDYKKKDKTRTLIKINCNQREYALIQKYTYDANGKVIKIDGEENEVYFTSIVPDSIIEMVYKITCYK